MRKFIIAASAATLLATGIGTATADPLALTPVQPAAASAGSTDTTGGSSVQTVVGTALALGGLVLGMGSSVLGNPLNSVSAGIPVGSQSLVLFGPVVLLCAAESVSGVSCLTQNGL